MTAASGGRPAGLIVNSFTSVSLDPALVAFCPSRTSLTWQRVRHARRFAANLLGRRHERSPSARAPAGDHSIVIGRVDELHTSPDRDPLVFFGGEFRGVR